MGFFEEIGATLGGIGDTIEDAVGQIGGIATKVIKTTGGIFQELPQPIQQVIFEKVGIPIPGPQAVPVGITPPVIIQQQPSVPALPASTAPISGGGRELAVALPGGAMVQQAGAAGAAAAALQQIQRFLAALGTAGGVAQIAELAAGVGGNGGAVGGLFRQAPTRVTPVRRIMQQNPMNPNRIEVWEHAGTPVLFSRDFRCAKRVRKIAARARRSRGGR